MKVTRKLKSAVILTLLLCVLVGGGVLVKNIFLSHLKEKIRSNFGYSRIQLSVFPPALILENVRSKSLSPFFSAERVSVKIAIKSLLSREKPLQVRIEDPVLRIYPDTSALSKTEKAPFSIVLPFAVEKGLIKNGELYYWGDNLKLQSAGINALFSQKKDKLSLLAEGEQIVLSLASSQKALEGKIDLFIEGKGGEFWVKKAKLKGPSGVITAEGILNSPSDPGLELKSSFQMRADTIVDLFNLPFDWEGRVEGRGKLIRRNEEINYTGEFSSNKLVLNGVEFGEVRSEIAYGEHAGGRMDFKFRKKKGIEQFVRIRFKKDRVEGEARHLYLDPIMNYVALPWPVSSPVWGNFSIEKGHLVADAEFRDNLDGAFPGAFLFKGRVHLNWDGEDAFYFKAPDLDSNFARVNVDGKVILGRNLDLVIQGDIKDLIPARRFTSSILQKEFHVPELRGQGKANIHIFGSLSSPQIRSSFMLSPAGFDQFNALHAEGEAEIVKDTFSSRINVEDPHFHGKINVDGSHKDLRVDILVDRGSLEEILPGLDIHVPLKGRAAGRFEYVQNDQGEKVKGQYESHQIEFSGQSLMEVRGRIEWSGGRLVFPELQFGIHNGFVRGSALIDFPGSTFSLDIKSEEIDLSSVSKNMEGLLAFSLEGGGTFGRDKASGNFEILHLKHPPFQEALAKGKLEAGITAGNLTVGIEGNFFPGENEFQLSFAFPFEKDFFSGKIKGSFSNIDLLVPWKGAKGQVVYLGEIRGPRRAPQVKGAIDLSGAVFPFPFFAHALRNYAGLVFVEDGRFTIRSFHGKIGGGDVQAFGSVWLGKGGVEEIDVRMKGENMLLAPLERTRALADGTMSLYKNAEQFVLNGDFLIRQLSWKRELTEKFAFSSRLFYQSPEKPSFFDGLNLNIRLIADEKAWMENSLGTVEGKFDLTVSGNVKAPIVMGEIEALKGEVYFQDRTFNVLRGQVSFLNPSAIKPYLIFKGETYVKDYRVTFSLEGNLERLTPEFSSSPPLPPEDVLALLALGEAFKRTYHYDRSTQISTASLLSFQISEEAKKRAGGLFSIDRFRIDPFILGTSSELTARLTLGKKISKNFSILYSTNLTTQREEITRLEWELTNDLSVVGTRDEEGRISIDVKIHKRF